MKRYRLLSCVLAGALLLSAGALPAAAAYPDVAADHWSAPYVEDMTAKGVFIGIEQNGKLFFMPTRKMSAIEALALCARVSVDTALRQRIGADRAEQIRTLTGEESFWARDEFATCLEAGIVSYAELKELWQSGNISRPIAKEDFCLYLVRAMQLSAMAENLSTVTLDFTDRDEVSPGMEPYVYLLTQYGIVNGNDNHAFQPRSTVTREVAAALLSRAIRFMEEKGTSVELSEYTDYSSWEAGSIVKAVSKGKDTIELTLNSDVSGQRTFSIPAATPIYENSMKVDSSLLLAGSYARICYDQTGKAAAVRLSGRVETVEGSLVGISENALMVSVGESTRTVYYDRFTEVRVGTKTGGRELIETDAGYDRVACRIDKLGHLVAVQLTGGTRKEEGLIRGAEPSANGETVLTVAAFDGSLQRYTIPASASVTANGITMTGFTGYTGCYIAMRVSNDSAAVESANVDSVTVYLQGAVRSTGRTPDGDSVTITDLATGKAAVWPIRAGAQITYGNKTIDWSGIEKDWFVTAHVVAGEIERLFCYPGSSRTEGVLSAISYPVGSTKQLLTVTTPQGAQVQFELDLASPPQIERDDKTSTPDKLRTGDQVVVTVRYNEVTLIDATSQNANVTGVIARKTETAQGITIEVTLDGGGSATYTLSSGVSVTQNGRIIDGANLRVGYRVAMVVSGNELVSIDVVGAVSTTDHITGTVIVVNDGRSITFRTGDDRVITVTLASGASIQSVQGSYVSLSQLRPGDSLDLYGSYEKGVFVATIAIKL